MTGWLVPGTPPTIAPRQDALTLVWTTIWGRPPDAPRAPIVQVSPLPSDTDLLAKAHAATNGPKFADLWAGHWQRYPYDSPSEADLGLCEMLCFWTQDPAQIARLFETSGLYRDKKGANAPTIASALSPPPWRIVRTSTPPCARHEPRFPHSPPASPAGCRPH